MATKVSKNAREGGRQTHRKPVCAAGHEQVWVLVVGRGMRLLCACSGYTPVDTSAPYRVITPRIKVGGNARIWFEQPRAGGA